MITRRGRWRSREGWAEFMTREEFNRMPALLSAAQVGECGVDRKALVEMTVVLTTGEEKVPFGKIGAVPYGHGRKKRYRKADLSKLIGF